MKVQFTEQDHRTWNQLFKNQSPLRSVQLIPEFSKGLDLLGITADLIPDMDIVNVKLHQLTGWKGIYVKGFVEVVDFFKMLARREFPIGSFIRDPKDLSYTPEPDVFHDLYGHIPFYTNPDYAYFSEMFGKSALKFADQPEAIEEYQRLFWFTVEFALVKTDQGQRIFGAGIASSFAECAYALSKEPTVLPFDIEIIRNRPFRIDLIQDTLFLLENTNQLYSCLNKFEEKYKTLK